jgi:hypothetical protein
MTRVQIVNVGRFHREDAISRDMNVFEYHFVLLDNHKTRETHMIGFVSSFEF